MSYFRKNIEELKPYIPGFQPGREEFVKLNTNENPYPPSKRVLKVIRDNIGVSLRLYPDPSGAELKSAAARVLGFKVENIIPGNGSDEILSLIFRAVLDKGDKAAITFPTYSLYKVLADIQAAGIEEHRLKQQDRLPASFFKTKAKLIIISNPNAPTGCAFPKKDIEKLCRAQKKALIVIDEAYVDFSTYNCLYMARKYRNVVVTRSLSKSYALAGMRIGLGIANKKTIDMLLKVKDSYNINRLSIKAGKAAMDDRQYFRKIKKNVIKTRLFLDKRLKSMGFETLPSSANFIFAKPPCLPDRQAVDAKKLTVRLEGKNILVRYFCIGWLKDYIRISVGTMKEIKIFLKKTETLLK
ncbi:MAG: histidinol-phosphate transaminase [Candidatus Aureabacteria bacterium]|nr:histidinol-phosphate transaminase [Candidatus Auribacterota bacterium]